jgi:hypothetical protein
MKGIVMLLIARIIAASLLTAGLGIVIGLMVFGQVPDRVLICFILACVGAIIGAVAGAGREIVTAMR